MVIGLAGAVSVARLVGPAVFGLYAGTFSIYSYVWLLSQWGINVFLIRRDGEPTEQEYHQASSLLLLLGLAGAGLGLLSLLLLRRWVHIDNVFAVGLALFPVLPVHLANLVPLARLERAMDYRRVALIELATQIANYAAAVPLAFLGAGVWAMVGGFWLQVITSSVLLFGMSGYRPRWHFRRELAGEMARYGIGFGSATWIWQLRNLVNPLVVGRYLGAEAVGYVALAIRVVDMLSFVRNATWRISIAALARIQQDRARLAQAITHGIWLQLLALGPLLLVFAWVGPWVLPVFFGVRWLPAMKVYPFIALGSMVNAGFNMHASTLAVRGRNGRAAAVAAALVVLFAAAASLLVGRVGILGYGWAEIAAMPAYVLYHLAIRTEVGYVSYSRALLWWCAFGIGLFTQYLGWWAILAPLSMLLLKDTWTSLAEIWSLVRKR